MGCLGRFIVANIVGFLVWYILGSFLNDVRIFGNLATWAITNIVAFVVGIICFFLLGKKDKKEEQK